MWCETHPNAIPNVSPLIYNNPMQTRCNNCMEIWDYSDYVHICPECLTDDYLMDLSVVPATITSNERI